VETQLLCLRVYLAFAAEGLAKRYLVYYHAIRAYGTVAENGALPADEDTLAQIVEQLGAGTHASVPHAPHRTAHARGLHAPHRGGHTPPCAAVLATGGHVEYLIAALKTYGDTKYLRNVIHPHKGNLVRGAPPPLSVAQPSTSTTVARAFFRFSSLPPSLQSVTARNTHATSHAPPPRASHHSRMAA
jgi:hypothetical protein